MVHPVHPPTQSSIAGPPERTFISGVYCDVGVNDFFLIRVIRLAWIDGIPMLGGLTYR